MDEDEARILRREYELEHGLEDDWESAQTGYEKWLNRSLDGGGG